MRKFFVTVALPETMEEDFWKLIPAHRSLINELMQEGTLSLYSVSATRTRGWMVIRGQSPEEVMELVRTFPIYKYYEGVEIDELFIYDNVAELPEIVMN